MWRSFLDARSRVVDILGVNFDVVTYDGAVARINQMVAQRRSAYVCASNVHSIVESSLHPSFRSVLNSADMVTPDGAPVAWLMRRRGIQRQRRISGPDLMLEYLKHAKGDHKIFLYGSSVETLELLEQKIAKNYPRVALVGKYSPPFRALTTQERSEVYQKINATGANVVFVGLGCPKQEFWMSDAKGRVNAVMIGLGAAFDYHAGVVKRAPLWMRDLGGEWLYRLISEPRRLWRRYAIANGIFIWLCVKSCCRDFRKSLAWQHFRG